MWPQKWVWAGVSFIFISAFVSIFFICNSRATQIAHEMLVEYFMALLVIMGLTATVDKQSRHSSQYFGHLAAAEELSNLIPDNYEGPDPIFDNSTEREIIAALGTTARLHCRVRNLGDRAVSWIRQRDLHILTIGIMTYTNDQRFLARHIDNSDEWVLKIVSVQPRDAGIYECQVSTEPKISLAYKLIVVTSKAQILANRELFIQSGSDINLTCIAPQAPGPYTHMLWHKDTELVSDSARGGIRVVSEQQMKTSNLVISRVLNTDSGNYTCSAENSNSDSVFVHIIKSEQHAAMQHELGARLELPPLPLLLLAALLVVLAPLAPLAASPVFPSSPAAAALAASLTHPAPL